MKEDIMNLFNLFDVTGRKALVTGAGRGIGRVLALALAEAGCDLSILVRNIKDIEPVVKEIQLLGRRCIAVQADVRKKGQVDRAFAEAVEELGRLDICVNNAGISIQKPAEEMSEEDWDNILDTNLKGVFLCCQAAARIMISQRQGTIINIASLSGAAVNVPQKQAVYNTSKAGVVMLSKSLAVEWAEYGIRVNSISPGYIKTEMTISSMTHLFPTWESLTPMKRLGEPEELRAAVLYLASNASSYMTGHDLVVDGGYTAR
jgi:NAD(P)-dependent dehydrogenase (short-subunit alcohol dehydrogenase family)